METKRIQLSKFKNQIFVIPAFGIVKNYFWKLRIAFAWLKWGVSIGLWRGEQ